jgi:Fe-S cluster assembly ATP-binding protein
MLHIENLHVAVGGKIILKGIDLDVLPGEVHAIMGPNGSGKSTLALVLAGREGYEILQGRVRYLDKPLLTMAAEERARAGLFLAFQYPLEIPGVVNVQMLRLALNAMRRARGEEELDAFDFLECVRDKLAHLGMDETFLYRSVNEGFSGGEKKRNEILQMAVLEPQLAILDETDSGLDIDSLKIVADGVNALWREDRAIILVTHYQRLLDYIVPNRVHVMVDGRLVAHGGHELALELEARGYGWLSAEPGEEVRP